MLKIIRFFRGYVRIRMEGFAPQRFLNLCSVHQIELWNIVINGCIYEMNLSVHDFFRLKPIVHKTKTKVVLLSKRGLPFWIRKWKKRKLFLGGFFLCMLCLFFLSRFVWDIELVGEGRLTKDMLLQFLEENEVTYGSYSAQIDIDKIEKKLRDEYPFIIWTSLKLEGTRLYVNIKENAQGIYTDAGSLEERDKPCDLCATVSGNVYSVITRSGVPQIVEGDEVKKGDVLVSGSVPVLNDDATIRDYMYVHADADVYIDTSLNYDKKLAYLHSRKIYTGKSKTAFYFRVYKKSFAMGGLPSYETYDIVTDLKQAKLLSDFYLPLYYGKIEYHEYETEDFIYSQKEAEEILKKEFQNFYETLQQKGVQIIANDVKIKKCKQFAKAAGHITVRMLDGDEKNITTGETNIE